MLPPVQIPVVATLGRSCWMVGKPARLSSANLTRVLGSLDSLPQSSESRTSTGLFRVSWEILGQSAMPSVHMDCQPPATVRVIVIGISSRCPGQQRLPPTCNQEPCCATHDVLLPGSSLHTDINDTCVPICSVYSDNRRICTESAAIKARNISRFCT
jgi:hypothetical protein